MNAPTPILWTLTDGRRGMENQCVGLAERLAETQGWPFEIKTISPGKPWSYLPESLAGRPWPAPFKALTDADRSALAPPWPDILIGCGRQSMAYSITIRKRNQGNTFTVQTQAPKLPLSQFDLIIPPEHDNVSGANVFPILGSPHRITPSRIAREALAASERFASLPRPLVGVLIGGKSRHYPYTPSDVDRHIMALRRLRHEGYGVLVTLSRRTGPEASDRYREGLRSDGIWLWDGSGDNPYFALLGLSDTLLVTEDSTNMVTEATATGKPVYLLTLEGGAAKFNQFHATLLERGIVRRFEGRLEPYSYTPLDETGRAAAEIARRYRAYRDHKVE
ncbi:MAG: mitochondrial fission ELM1 family protein, partial [Pseudomonadota bacterium]